MVKFYSIQLCVDLHGSENVSQIQRWGRNSRPSAVPDSCLADEQDMYTKGGTCKYSNVTALPMCPSVW